MLKGCTLAAVRHRLAMAGTLAEVCILAACTFTGAQTQVGVCN